MKLNTLYDYGVMPIHIGAAILCACLLLAGWLFGMGPLMSESHQATSVIEQAEQAEFEAKRVKGELDRLSNELISVQEQLDLQPVNLMSASQINPLLSELAQWSELHDLGITSTSAGRPEALTYYDYVPIQIEGEGGFGDFLSFLDRLYKDRGDLGVITFGVQRLASGHGVSFDIDLAWYVCSDDREDQPGPQPTASVPTP